MCMPVHTHALANLRSLNTTRASQSSLLYPRAREGICVCVRVCLFACRWPSESKWNQIRAILLEVGKRRRKKKREILLTIKLRCIIERKCQLLGGWYVANGADTGIKRSGRNNGEPGPAHTQPHAGPTCTIEQNRCCLLSLGASTKVTLVWEENMRWRPQHLFWFRKTRIRDDNAQ